MHLHGAPSLGYPQDAPVLLAEVCGGLLAASPLLGIPGEVSRTPPAALPRARVLSAGGLARCPLLVPGVDRGASITSLLQNEWRQEFRCI